MHGYFYVSTSVDDHDQALTSLKNVYLNSISTTERVFKKLAKKGWWISLTTIEKLNKVPFSLVDKDIQATDLNFRNKLLDRLGDKDYVIEETRNLLETYGYDNKISNQKFYSNLIKYLSNHSLFLLPNNKFTHHNIFNTDKVILYKNDRITYDEFYIVSKNSNLKIDIGIIELSYVLSLSDKIFHESEINFIEKIIQKEHKKSSLEFKILDLFFKWLKVANLNSVKSP